MKRAALVAGASALFAACTCAAPPGPVLTSVEPTRTGLRGTTVLTIHGSGFFPLVRADLDHPAQTQVDAGFALALVRGVTRAPLSDVTLLSETTIGATLPPGVAAVGMNDLELVDPRGRGAFLGAAFEVACVPDGDPCDDGSLCTFGGTCVSKVCQPAGAIACTPPPECHGGGACNPVTGTCSAPVPLPEGTTCNDGDPCTDGDSCRAGLCVGTLIGTPTCSAHTNTPPLACLSVRPAGGTAVTTQFALDASCSRDLEPGALSFRFDRGDGSGFSAASSSATATATYALPAIRDVAVMVTDSGAPQVPPSPLTEYASLSVAVAASADVVLVRTAADESDPGATPSAPGGTGLSLREAIAYVNGPPLLSGKLIAFDPAVFAAPAAIAITNRLPALAAPGTAIAGLPGLALDFSGVTLPTSGGCVRLGADGQSLVGLEIRGCRDAAVYVPAGLTGYRVVDCTIRGPGASTASSPAVGISVSSPGTVGPRNDVSGFNTGVDVKTGGTVIDGNRIHGNVAGIWVHGVDVTIQRNDIYGNAGPGVDLATTTYLDRIWFNTIDGNSGDGIDAKGAVLDVRDNLITWNGGYGLNAPGGTFTAPGSLDHDGYFGNANGSVGGTATQGPTDVPADPLYVSRSAGDYRLLPASPARGRGFDLGLDVNGPFRTGNCNGACDLGAHEYPAP